ncbi:hypothetical protein MKX03_024888 [Papaver bracteatum]|nr:hypothetical protein MKX03_024888 [Papaver bracteatum]
MSTKQKQSKISFGGSKQPVDPTWEHCKVVNPGNKFFLTCNYCGNKSHGGVYRIKHHLAQTKNNVAMCKEVTPEVKKFFLDYIQKFENDKEKCEELGELNVEDELGTNEKDDACMAICDFFYVNALPFNVVNIKSFKKMLNVVGEFGKGDLIRAGATRFATNYLNLKSFHVCKVALRKMVTSDAWTKSKYAKEQVGIKVQTIILSDENFWQSVISCLKSVIPIVKVLRLVDGDDKPEMGYIYKAIDKAKEQIQANFKNVKRRYEYATDFVPNIDVKLGFYDAIKRMCPSAAERYKIDKQIELFTSAGGMFGHVMARETRNKKHPALWWKSYGDSAPELQRLVVRILSSTCSASVCERNWSIFEQQRLNALVYVKYNLQLNERFTKIKEQRDSYDPICLSYMESDDEWITEKDDASLQPDPTWMDVHDCFQITEVEANKKKRKRGPRNLSTMKLAQGKWNNNGKEARLVEENEIEEVEEDETEEETCVEEMSETEIQAESDNEWLSDDGYDMGDH